MVRGARAAAGATRTALRDVGHRVVRWTSGLEPMTVSDLRAPSGCSPSLSDLHKNFARLQCRDGGRNLAARQMAVSAYSVEKLPCNGCIECRYKSRPSRTRSERRKLVR
jgi:hypothetical protein